MLSTGHIFAVIVIIELLAIIFLLAKNRNNDFVVDNEISSEEYEYNDEDREEY